MYNLIKKEVAEICICHVEILIPTLDKGAPSFCSEYILKSLPPSVLVKVVACSDIQEHLTMLIIQANSLRNINIGFAVQTVGIILSKVKV